MSVTQYIGARYVPLFADPIDWNINSQYEPLTIVYYQGNSYTSKQAVPSNIDITNTDYWAITGNYNAQIEQYRAEVQTFDGRITANAQAIADEVTARMQEDTAIRALITALDGDLATETSARAAADTQIRTDFAQDLADEVSTLNATISADVARLDQQDSALSSRISVFEDKSEIMVFVGDSYGEGFDPDGATDNSKGWCNRLKGLVQAAHPNVTCLTDWVNGGRLATALVDKATTLLNGISSADRKKVTKIVIAGGYNDARLKSTQNEFDTSFGNLATLVKSNFPNANVYISSVGGTISFKTTGKYATTTSQDCYTAYFYAKASAESHGFVFDDGSFATLIRYAWFASDFVHPNPDGNLIIAKRLFKLIYTGQGYFPGMPVSDGCEITASNDGRLEAACQLQASYGPAGFPEEIALTGSALQYIKVAYDTPRTMSFNSSNYHGFAKCSIPAFTGTRGKFPAVVSVREASTGNWYSNAGIIMLTSADDTIIVSTHLTRDGATITNMSVDRLYVQPITLREILTPGYNS